MERLVHSLTAKVNEKSAEITQLQQLNVKYKAKIKEFVGQNSENVKLAHSELEAMRQECERNQNAQHVLGEEVRTLRSQINDLLLKNYELEKK
jgi:hypothetical protein